MAIAFTDRPAEDDVLRRAVEQADLILTVTSRRLLDRIVPWLSELLNGRETRHYLLFCENGLHIARSFANRFGRHTVLVDTVMSRMCRFDTPHRGAGYAPDGAAYRPLWPGHDEALVVEDYDFWPLDARICEGGPFSAAFSLVPPEEFLLWEDIKLYMHNGMHAFVAYPGFPGRGPVVRRGVRCAARSGPGDDVGGGRARDRPHAPLCPAGGAGGLRAGAAGSLRQPVLCRQHRARRTRRAETSWRPMSVSSRGANTSAVPESLPNGTRGPSRRPRRFLLGNPEKT